MLRTLIKDGKISPAISGYNYKNPDTDVWNDDVIKILKVIMILTLLNVLYGMVLLRLHVNIVKKVI